MRRIVISLMSGVLIGYSFSHITPILAEQSGSTPNSGVTSYLKSTYDAITTLGHGSTSFGSWGNWGGMWNRIRSAAEWTPDSGLDPSEVLGGETFYSGSRAAQTGTADAPDDFSYQAYAKTDEIYEGEAVEWLTNQFCTRSLARFKNKTLLVSRSRNCY